MSAESLRVTSPVSRKHWQTVHGRDPSALIPQSPVWVDCVLASGYEDATRMYESASGWGRCCRWCAATCCCRGTWRRSSRCRRRGGWAG